MKMLAQWFVALIFLSLTHAALADDHENKNEAVARGWVEAAQSGKDEFAAYVKKHMAEDGVWHQNRYVGFGFSMDPTNDEQLVVAIVTPGTPAAEVLKAGDVFVSVAGVPATEENRDRMNFRGKPGAPVKAVISRGGKEIPIEVRRGVIDHINDKAAVLENIALGDAEEWPVDSGSVLEVISDGSAVVVVDEFTDTEEDTGIQYVNRGVTHFQFNDKHQVVKGWSLDESRFVLEQLGYTISR
ncbi:PDZ domain-containing protein [Parahaliea aestuarii]|uniref:PDZ domain-containing protein n=1 Tax=Parahaliea aestuarii TaxID=1852021 RepID=A0A5C8ZMI0_9GAMM|nr:PDZ domain-containing protein [Parahaliea aestuarii]TXS88972.1 PDZ domain-containing protein [Parahaliea aestuarii]